jgi:small subunit ribosomal protein S1
METPVAQSLPRQAGSGERARVRDRLARLVKREEFRRARPRRGQVYEATVLAVGEHDMLVDFGAKRNGVILPRDLELVDDEAYVNGLAVGDRVPVVVLSDRAAPDGILVSLNKGLQQRDWLRAHELQESGEIVEAEVVDVNRGGVLVAYGRLQGFVPNSHLTSISRGLRGKRLREAKGALVGRTFQLKVLEVAQRRRRFVLSERAASHQKRKELLAELMPGEVRTGVVQNLVDFGAFVDLGGIDGLVHISELDDSHVGHPSEVLSVGDELEVYVLDVDRERERISLSRKRLLPDAWESVTLELRQGDVVPGTVTGVQEYGAFIDVAKGVEGLAHVSKMPEGQATLAHLRPGQHVSVRVLSIDNWEKKIGLEVERVGSDESGVDTLGSSGSVRPAPNSGQA